jgi:SAM-dependent methyltransferase
VLELCSKRPLPDSCRKGPLEVRFVDRWPVERAQAWAFSIDWRHRWFQGFDWLPPDLRRSDSSLLWRFMGERDFAGKTVLDFGCNDGYHAQQAARRGAQVLGVDINEKTLKVARTVNDHVLGRDVRFLPGETPPEGLWDLTFSLSVWHQPDPTYDRLEEHLQDMRRRAREVVFVELINPPLEGSLSQDQVDLIVARQGGRKLYHYRHQVRRTRTLYELPGAPPRAQQSDALPPVAVEGRRRLQDEVVFEWVDEDVARVRALFAREAPACLVRAGDGELKILRRQSRCGPRLVDGLARALAETDLVGLPRGHQGKYPRGTHSHKWDEALIKVCREEHDQTVDPAQSVSAVLFLLAPELLGRLCRGKRVLIVNHGASKLVQLLGDPAFRERYGMFDVAAHALDIPDGVVTPRGKHGEELDGLLDAICQEIRAAPDFDLCVLGAGAMGKPIALYVRDVVRRHCVDVGALLSAMQGQRNRHAFKPGGARDHLVWTG